jgi:14-3-3 protein epsilon
MAQREEIVFMAKVYSETERYEEMRDCLKQLALLGEPFSHEERHLLSIAYSNLVGSKRKSLRLV